MRNMMILLADVKEQIENKIKHPYLFKHIETPIIDEDMLLLLIAYLSKERLPDDKLQQYCITIMLIQIALDTHETVSNQKLDAENLKPRQLTVLAGVYYSGLYYKILSEIDEIGMIRLLAEGIKDINEHKISLYQKDMDHVDALMNDVKMIESSLFVKITSYLDDTYWSEFASNLLFIKRLKAERDLFLNGRESVVFDALKKVTLSNDEKDLLAICDEYLNGSRKLIQENLLNIPQVDELVDKRIQSILNDSQSLANTFVEEG
ncbi:heptaprenyl diphosphate synthase [Cytobacillus eiseniae]|uniref:Heptaprenyl diphosphate synthase n=1 Tax=Cytobacillus eiseniae TaxID=762947 RepID=A0ABS4RGC9_9BACI|nr:heptaprenyl diphosphate synthase component 1 [Cytobacillus eiseniae]MBP2241379.1 heptaprenyl diphosphate synthase [Cytobacillus eiseniae]